MFWAVKNDKKRFCDGQKFNMFWKRPDFLEVSVSSFADRQRVFDQKYKKYQKTIDESSSVYECIALFPRELPRKIHIHSYTNCPMPFQKGPVFKNCCIFPRQISRKSANGRNLFAKCVYRSVCLPALAEEMDTHTSTH